MPGSDHGTIAVDLALTNLSVALFNDAFVITELCPEVPVGFNENTYFEYDKSHLRIPEAIRADGEESGTVFRRTKTLSFVTNEYALGEFITDKQVKRAAYALRPAQSAVRRLTEQLKLKRESVGVTEALAALSTASCTSAVTNNWDEALGTPVSDLRTIALPSIMAKSMHAANTLCVPYLVALAMAANAEVAGIIKYTSVEALITAGLPPTILDCKVHVAGAHYMSTNIGLTTDTLLPVWGENVIAAYVNPTPDLESISFGYWFMAPDQTSDLRGFQVLRFREPKRKGEKVEVSVTQVQKIVCAGAGYSFTSTLT